VVLERQLPNALPTFDHDQEKPVAVSRNGCFSKMPTYPSDPQRPDDDFMGYGSLPILDPPLTKTSHLAALRAQNQSN